MEELEQLATSDIPEIEQVLEFDDTQSEASEPEYSPLEQEALAKGWDPSKPKSAEQWMEDKDFKSKIMRELNEQKAFTQQLVQHNLRATYEAEKRGYEKAIAELREKQIEASRIGDDEAVLKYQDQLIENATKLAAVQEPVQEQPKFTQDDVQAYQSWVQQNSNWYGQSQDMKAVADGFFNAAFAKNMSVQDAIKEVNTNMKRVYPQKFGAVAPTHNGVEGGIPRSPKIDKTNPMHLPKDWRSAYERDRSGLSFKNEASEKAWRDIWISEAWSIIDSEKKS